jgi:hypothetical protein
MSEAQNQPQNRRSFNDDSDTSPFWITLIIQKCECLLTESKVSHYLMGSYFLPSEIPPIQLEQNNNKKFYFSFIHFIPWKSWELCFSFKLSCNTFNRPDISLHNFTDLSPSRGSILCNPISPCSQEPATGPYREPNKTSLHTSILYHNIRFNIVTYPEFAWLIRRVLDLMIEFIGTSYNWLQQFTNHYLTHSSTSDWTLHWNYSDFQWTPLYSAVLLCTPSILIWTTTDCVLL